MAPDNQLSPGTSASSPHAGSATTRTFPEAKSNFSAACERRPKVPRKGPKVPRAGATNTAKQQWRRQLAGSLFVVPALPPGASTLVGVQQRYLVLAQFEVGRGS